MADIDPLQQMVNLTAAALGVADVQLVVLDLPGIDLRAARSITTSSAWSARLGYENTDAPSDGGLADWVRSIAVAPLTGPSGEAGYLIAGHDEADRFDDTTLEVLSRVVGLAESYLDRTVEQVRMDRLGEVLHANEQQLREARNRLVASNEELEQFAYIAAHELVAPLRAVSLYAEVLEPLVTAKLELSNVQGDLSQISVLDLTDIVTSALTTLSAPLDEAGAIVEVGSLPKVRGRSVPLQSVFANLLSNSVRYRHPGRALKIEISAQEKDGQALVRVADNGVGIDPESQDRIFQMFERGTTAIAGSGIGLALSRRIVEAVGGDLALLKSSDEGAEFSVSLRLA